MAFDSSQAGSKRNLDPRSVKLITDRWAYYRTLRDPFDTTGGTIPDDYPLPTVRLNCRSIVSCTGRGTTAGDNSFLVLFYPGVNDAYTTMCDSATPGLLGTATVANVDQYTPVTTMMSRYRPIGAKLYIEFSQALTAAQGDVQLGVIDVSSAISGLTAAAVSQLFLKSRVFSLPSAGPDKHVLWSPTDASDEEFQLCTAAAINGDGTPNNRTGVVLAALFRNMTPYSSSAVTYANAILEQSIECIPNQTYSPLLAMTTHLADPAAQAACTNRHMSEGYFSF